MKDGSTVLVRFLGSGDAFGSGGRLQSCILLSHAGGRCLIDCGASVMVSLRRFEIDTLKVDFSFVSRIDTDEESWEIIRTIVTLGNNLGKDVVAEGIERGKQRELRIALRCKYGQGYFFSRPVDAEAATALLAADSRGESLLKVH